MPPYNYDTSTFPSLKGLSATDLMKGTSLPNISVDYSGVKLPSDINALPALDVQAGEYTPTYIDKNGQLGSVSYLNTGKTDWGMDGWGGFGLGIGQLGLGLASYLDNKKTADKQRKIMDQQIKQNNYNYNKTIADNKHLQQIFNPSNK